MRRRDFIKYLGLGGVAMLAMPQSIRANSSAVAVSSSCKKLKPISGSWFEFRHSASEGGNWNKALTHFTADQWRRKIFEMREIGMEYDGCSSGWKAVLSFTDSSSNPDGM